MAISFVTASAGAVDTTGAWTATGSAPTAVGNIIILHAVQDGTTDGSLTFTSATNIENLAGTDNAWTAIGEFSVGASDEARQYLWIGRAINGSAPTFTGGNSSGEDVYYRMYEFSGCSLGTTLATVIENVTAGATVNGTGTSTTVADTGVTTLGPNRLALNFSAFNDDLTGFGGSFTGETGGDWTSAGSYGTSTGTDASMNLNTAAIASAGTINGGTYTITSMAWGVVGFALIPANSGALTGTITASVNESDIVAGGKTLIITLTDDEWIAAGAASFDLQRDEIIAGCDSAQSEATGWDLVPKATQSLGGVVRTSASVVTITWDAFATYNISAQETITVTVPAAATVAGVGPVATPTFTIDTASAAVEVLPGTGAAVFTGFAPSVTIGVNVLPGTGQAVFAGFAPTVQTPRNVTPGVGQAVFTGFAPTIEISEPPPPAPPQTITGILATMFYALRRRKMKQVRV